MKVTFKNKDGDAVMSYSSASVEIIGDRLSFAGTILDGPMAGRKLISSHYNLSASIPLYIEIEEE